MGDDKITDVLLKKAIQKINEAQSNPQKQEKYLNDALELLSQSVSLGTSAAANYYSAYCCYLLKNEQKMKQHIASAELEDFEYPPIADLRKKAGLPSFEEEDAPTTSDSVHIKVRYLKLLYPFPNGIVSPVNQDFRVRVDIGYVRRAYVSAFVHIPELSGQSLDIGFGFQANLTVGSRKYNYGYQPLIVSLENAANYRFFASEVNLFQIERSSRVSHSVTLRDISGSAIGTLGYTLVYKVGIINPNEAAKLFYHAVYANDKPMINYLLRFHQKSVDENMMGKIVTPMGLAARLGKARMVKDFIRLGADVNKLDESGKTALIRALEVHAHPRFQNNIPVARLLVRNGADLTVKTREGYDTFAYCGTFGLQAYLRSLLPSDIFYIRAVVCQKCKYLHFPVCYEGPLHCFKTEGCICPKIMNCENCGEAFSEKDDSDANLRVFSGVEIQYLEKAYSEELPPVFSHALVFCTICSSAGFPGTMSPEGSRLVVYKEENGNGFIEGFVFDEEKMVEARKNGNTEARIFKEKRFTLEEGSRSWSIAEHHMSCTLPILTFQHILLSTKQKFLALELVKNSKKISWSNIKMDSRNFLERCDENILLNIMTHLQPQDIGWLAQTCKPMYNVSKKSLLWTILLKKHFNQANKDPSGRFLQEYDYTILRDRTLQLEEMRTYIGDLLFSDDSKYRIEWNFTTATIYLSLAATKMTFNLDGQAFQWENDFEVILEFDKVGETNWLKMVAPNQPGRLWKLVAASGQAALPETNPTFRDDDRLDIHFQMNNVGLKNFVNPYLQNMGMDIQAFIAISDDIGGSVVLDFFYYSVEKVLLHST